MRFGKRISDRLRQTLGLDAYFYRGLPAIGTCACLGCITPNHSVIPEYAGARRREKDTMALAATISLNITKQAEAMLFELRVLECLLADTVQYFEARAHRLEFLMESVLTEVRALGTSDATVRASSPARYLGYLIQRSFRIADARHM